MEILDHNYDIKDYGKVNNSKFNSDEHMNIIEETIHLEHIDTTLVNELTKIDTNGKHKINVIYPIDYLISFEEFDLLKPLLKGIISVTKQKPIKVKEDIEKDPNGI